MPVPARFAYQHNKTSVIAEGAATHAKALEIAHRNFAELRDVEDERIHFYMFIKRHATSPMKSRISPDIWESFFQGFEPKPDRGLMVVYIEVDKSSWVKRLGFAKDRKTRVEAAGKPDDDIGSEKLPEYSKATM